MLLREFERKVPRKTNYRSMYFVWNFYKSEYIIIGHFLEWNCSLDFKLYERNRKKQFISRSLFTVKIIKKWQHLRPRTINPSITSSKYPKYRKNIYIFNNSLLKNQFDKYFSNLLIFCGYFPDFNCGFECKKSEVSL
jgi:hypothetical protein